MVGAPVRVLTDAIVQAGLTNLSYRDRRRCQLSRRTTRSALLARHGPNGCLGPSAIVFEKCENVPVVIERAIAGALHFGEGLLVAPALEIHAIDGAVRSRAVQSGEAVNQHRIVRRVAHYFAEDLESLFDRRRPF